VLVDGYMRAEWRVEQGLLEIAPYGRLTRRERAEVAGEGERLLAFLAPEAERVDVQIAPPS
jgi:hypothetical protein